ncbi:MAG: hypothetical protein Q9184_002897 [Pyrenodesmia sp. 2 TL-2023]
MEAEMSAQHSGQAGLALPSMTCSALIEHVLRYHRAPSAVVVCSSRESFLESLHSALQAEHTAEDSAETGRTDDSLHPILLPTIHQLANSRTNEIAFAPTLPHLRAYLASYTPTRPSTPPSTAFDKSGSRVAMLVVYGLLNLHRATTEYSVQGLSRTLAVAAEAANTWGMRLTLVEAPEPPGTPFNEPVMGAETANSQNPWAEQLPLLNSILTLSNDRAWVSRTVDVGAVVARCNETAAQYCTDGTTSPVYVGLGTEGEDSAPNARPPLAPMPFATPASIVPITTAASSVIPSPSSIATTLATLPATTLPSILTQYTPSLSSPSKPTSSLETMMQGNPMPSPTYLHTSTLIGISIVGVLAFSIFPLLIFGIVMNFRLQKAKAFQLGQGPRRPLEWGREGWEEGLEERRREWVVDDMFMRGFRRRVEGRAFLRRGRI